MGYFSRSVEQVAYAMERVNLQPTPSIRRPVNQHMQRQGYYSNPVCISMWLNSALIDNKGEILADFQVWIDMNGF